LSAGAFIAVESLSELLIRELADLRRFCALLAEERKVLTGAEADRLADIASEKSSLASQLSQVETRRDALLVKSGFCQGAVRHRSLARQPAGCRCRAAPVERGAETRPASPQRERNQWPSDKPPAQAEPGGAFLAAVGGADSIYGTDGQQRSLADGKRSFGTV
jgi:hypothetical protein